MGNNSFICYESDNMLDAKLSGEHISCPRTYNCVMAHDEEFMPLYLSTGGDALPPS